MLERQYQASLINLLKEIFPGCFVIVNDGNYIQGLPDLTLLYGNKWAMLEVKASEKSKERPNQRHYIDRFNEQGFASFIYPENEAEVLRALEQALAG